MLSVERGLILKLEGNLPNFRRASRPQRFCKRPKRATLIRSQKKIMLAEAGKLFSFIVCLLSLYSVFCAAFLKTSVELGQRTIDAAELLVLAATISIISGLIFREADREWKPRARLISALPLQIFCWASGGMTILFLLSLYLASHCVFYRDVRFYAGM
jgi:hypothetical protein